MQAFRFMSHKFHGRGSGKRKQERRIKKIQDEHVCVWRGVVRCLKDSAILLSQVNTVILQLYASERICKNKPYNLLMQSLLTHSIWSPCLIFTFKHNINFNEARVSCMCLIFTMYIHTWQSCVEIKDYSVAYFDCIAAFKVPYRWIFIKGRARMWPAERKPGTLRILWKSR